MMYRNGIAVAFAAGLVLKIGSVWHAQRRHMNDPHGRKANPPNTAS